MENFLEKSLRGQQRNINSTIIAYIGCPCYLNDTTSPPQTPQTPHPGRKCGNKKCNKHISWFCSLQSSSKFSCFSCGWCGRFFCMACDKALLLKCKSCGCDICGDCLKQDDIDCPDCQDNSIYFLYYKHLGIQLPDHISRLFEDGDEYESESERLFDDQLFQLNNLV